MYLNKYQSNEINNATKIRMFPNPNTRPCVSGVTSVASDPVNQGVQTAVDRLKVNTARWF